MDKKIKIPAIHDKDLKNILEDLGLLERLNKGELHCFNCSKQITWENLFALKVADKELVIFCDEPDCIDNSTDEK